MADFEVRPSMIKKYSSNQDKIANSLMRISGEINSCVVGLRGCISSSSYRYIQNSLSSISRKVENNAKNVYNMNNALNQISKQYVTTENKLKETKVKNEVVNTNTNKLPSWAKNLSSIIGEFGLGGSLISAAIYSKEGLTPSFGKALLGVIGSGASLVGNIIDKKPFSIFGLNSSIDAIGFRENLAMQLEKYKINSSYNSVNTSSAAKQAHNISAFAKWGAVALTGVDRFVKNVKEYNGDFSNKDLYIETIGETAVKVGTGIVLKAVIGAGVAAVAGASAPAWIAGVGAVAAGIALDNVAKNVFHKDDFAELVSDGAISAAKNIGNGLNSIKQGITNSVGKGIRNIGKSIAKWF